MYRLAELLNGIKGGWRYTSVLVHEEIEADRHMMGFGSTNMPWRLPLCGPST
jgi:hypothetical protein